MPRDEPFRLFWAIDPPAELKDLLAHLQAKGRHLAPHASWPDVGKLHLTVAFLGEVPRSRVPLLLEAGRTAASHHDRFTLRTTELGGFPNTRAARVLWLGAGPEEPADALAEELRKAMARLGHPADGKPFKPHMTLARFRTPTDIAIFGEVPSSMEFEVSGLVLYRSELQTRGSVYTPLGTSPLG